MPLAIAAALFRRVARLKVRLETAEAAEVDTAFLERVAGDLGLLSDLIGRRYLMAGPAAPTDGGGPE